MIITENISSMEPMLPPDGERKLEDLAVDLATKASVLASQLPPAVRRAVGDLCRSMNCYYSNLIEGHDTHPRDIDRALAQADYSADPTKRALQHEAVAHIGSHDNGAFGVVSDLAVCHGGTTGQLGVMWWRLWYSLAGC